MARTIQDFYNYAIGKAFDIDKFYGAQCWDGYAEYCRWLGVPYANCNVTGYAQDIWKNRENNGALIGFEPIYALDKLHDGDVIVFDRNAQLPGSHVGIFRKYDGLNGVVVLGQNQRGDGSGYAFTQDWYDKRNIIGALRPKEFSKPTTPPKPQKPIARKITYTTHIQNKGWLPPVWDGAESGFVGQKLRVEALKIDTKYKIKAKAHIQDIGWVDYGLINKDTIIGTEHKSKRLECLILEPIDCKLKGRVHIQDKGWTDWFNLDGNITLGTVGESLRLECIQLKIC